MRARLFLISVGGFALVAAASLGLASPPRQARLMPFLLEADYLEAARVIQEVREVRGFPPRDTSELMRAFDLHGAQLTYTRRTGDAWLDPWGRPMRYSGTRLHGGRAWAVRLYSVGPNGIDDNAFGDDIPLDRTHPAGRRAAGLLKGNIE